MGLPFTPLQRMLIGQYLGNPQVMRPQQRPGGWGKPMPGLPVGGLSGGGYPAPSLQPAGYKPPYPSSALGQHAPLSPRPQMRPRPQIYPGIQGLNGLGRYY